MCTRRITFKNIPGKFLPSASAIWLRQALCVQINAILGLVTASASFLLIDRNLTFWIIVIGRSDFDNQSYNLSLNDFGRILLVTPIISAVSMLCLCCRKWLLNTERGLTSIKEQFYRQTTLQVLERLHATPQGLLTTEAMEQLQKNGPNELPQGKKITLWQRIIAQFKDLMILILMAAAVVAAFAGELSDAIIICWSWF